MLMILGVELPHGPCRSPNYSSVVEGALLQRWTLETYNNPHPQDLKCANPKPETRKRSAIAHPNSLSLLRELSGICSARQPDDSLCNSAWMSTKFA